MSLSSNVQPRKTKKQPGKPWDCKCQRNPHYLIRCPRCGMSRP